MVKEIEQAKKRYEEVLHGLGPFKLQIVHRVINVVLPDDVYREKGTVFKRRLSRNGLPNKVMPQFRYEEYLSMKERLIEA